MVFGFPTCPFGLPTCCLAAGTHRVSQVLARFSRRTPRFCPNPGRPSENSPFRSLCVGFQFRETVAVCSLCGFHRTCITRLFQVFRKCGLPCGLRRSLCTLQGCRSVADVRYLCSCLRRLIEVAGIPSSTPRFSLFDGNSSNRPERPPSSLQHSVRMAG